MRNTNKIIMFDFGGITECHDDGSGSTYDYRTIFIDAIRYAIGMRACDDFRKDDELLWEKFKSADCNDSLFRYASTLEDMRASLGMWLCMLACESPTYAGTFTERFIQYVKARNVMCPYYSDVIKIQMELKDYCLIGAMTNISWMWSPRFHQLTDCIGYDITWESFKMGFLKPETAAYKSVETMCGLSGKQILLLDDTEENVRAAIDNGWYAYKVEHGRVRADVETVAMDFIRGYL